MAYTQADLTSVETAILNLSSGERAVGLGRSILETMRGRLNEAFSGSLNGDT